MSWSTRLRKPCANFIDDNVDQNGDSWQIWGSYGPTLLLIVDEVVSGESLK